jgi:hypothetical protein
MNKKSNNKSLTPNSVFICVYFGLSKGEGEWPDVEVLTPKERKDPRTFCDFTLDLDEGGSSVSPKVIKSCKILYDGASPLPGFDDDEDGYGISVTKGGVVANLRPVIEFELAHDVDPDEFCRLVWGSTYMMSPQNADEPFYCEDWNGYTEILSSEQKDQWVEHLKSHNCFSGKVFKPQELQKGISAKKMEVLEDIVAPGLS